MYQKNEQDPKPCQQLLSGHTALKGLIEQSMQLRKANQILLNALPDLSQHCRIINIQNEKVTIKGESSIWTTMMRYEGETILRPQLNELFPSTERIQFIYKIRPETIEKKIKMNPKKSFVLSENTRQLLQDTAKNISHERLRTALLNLIVKK